MDEKRRSAEDRKEEREGKGRKGKEREGKGDKRYEGGEQLERRRSVRSCFIYSRPVASSAQVEFHSWNLNKGGQGFSVCASRSPPSTRAILYLERARPGRLSGGNRLSSY